MSVDVDPEVVWAAGYGPAEVAGLCPHACPHEQFVSVAAGPDERRKELVMCMESVCQDDPTTQCRQWRTVRDRPWGPWRHVLIEKTGKHRA